MNSGKIKEIRLTALRRERLTRLFVFFVPLVLFWDVISGARVLFNKDIQLSLYPLKTYLRDKIFAGEFPLWSPELGLGMPFLALPETGSLYPLNLLLLLPWPACIGQLVAVHVALASMGMYLLAKDLKIKTEGAVFGAFVFSMGGYLLSMASSSGIYAMSASWMPLVIYLARRAAARADKSSIVYLGLALACQALSGEFQGCILTVLLASVFSFNKQNKLRTLGRFAVSGSISVLVAMPQIVSTLSLIGSTRRSGGTSFQEASGLSLHPLRLVEMGVSGFLGNISERMEYLGFYMNRIGSSWTASPWSDSVYCGSIALVFTAFCLIRVRVKPVGWQSITGLVGLFALLLALGEFTPFFYVYHLFFPLAYLFRYPEKLFVIVSFAVAILSAYGVSNWLGTPRRSVTGVSLLGGIWGLFVIVILAITIFASPIAGHLAQENSWILHSNAMATIRNGCNLEIGVLLLSGLAVYLIARHRPKYRGVAVVTCLLIQLVFFNSKIIQTVSPDLYSRDNLVARTLVERTPDDLPVRLLNSPFTPPVYADCMASIDNGEFATWKQTTLMMNSGIMYGVGYYHSYIGMKSEQAKRFWKETKDQHRQIMDLFSIPFGIFPLAHETKKDPTLERILADRYPCLGIYKSKTTLPIARPVHKALPSSSIEDVIARLSTPGVLGGETALIESIESPWTAPANTGPGRCESKPPSTGGFETQCVTTSPSWVVVNVGYSPQMVALIDGKPAELKRANGIVSAVFMPEGTHRLKLVHEDRFLTSGLVAALLTLLVCFLVIGLEFKKSIRNKTAR